MTIIESLRHTNIIGSPATSFDPVKEAIYNDVNRDVLKRWELPIRVFISTKSTESAGYGNQRINEALDKIERFLKSNGHKDPIFVREEISSSEMSGEDGPGIYFFKVTKSNEKMSTAWVSRYPRMTTLPDEFIRCDGVLSGVIFVNYRADREVSTDVFIHELGHAMGMYRHFQGFDSTAKKPIDKEFWSVLQLLYHYAPGTPEAGVNWEP
jgi:hypothetical protein